MFGTTLGHYITSWYIFLYFLRQLSRRIPFLHCNQQVGWDRGEVKITGISVGLEKRKGVRERISGRGKYLQPQKQNEIE